MNGSWRWAMTIGALALLVASMPAAAQGTWMQTQCLAGTGADSSCKAAPAWGQTGLDYVQRLAATAGPGNLGLSLAKPETLPAANAARSQLAAVMLGYLNNDQQAATYRWFGPVVPSVSGPRAAPLTGATLNAAASAPASAPSATANLATPALHTLWLSGALGDEVQSRSASWWLASPYLGTTAQNFVDNGADPYRVLRFLAAQCPQLEGKVAPNAWTRCTTRQVPEPSSAALALVALLMTAVVRGMRGVRGVPGVSARGAAVINARWKPARDVQAPC